MPRAKLEDLGDFRTTTHIAKMLKISPYLVKARIQDGTFPPPSRTSESGVLLFDNDWLKTVQTIASTSTPALRIRRTNAPNITSPATWFGHELGESGWLPRWAEVVSYFTMLAEESPRVSLETIGHSTNGLPYIVLRISAAENLTADALERNREILGHLWDGREQSLSLDSIDKARTVAVILATQHSNEIGSLLMTMQLAWKLATATDEQTLQVLSETISVLIPSHNPDGADMIAEWYLQSIGEPWEGVGMPWLYHPYVGHDNNRDWFMQTQIETRHFIALHNLEHPQAVFDMHQMGRFGPRYMVPPFIDPLDPNQDPVVQQGFAALGSHIAQRMTANGLAGVVTHAIFDNYSPSLAYGNYHGSVDLLSEAASVRLATPVTIKESELNDDYGIDPRVRAWNQPLVWEAGDWSLKDIVTYNLVAATAFLEHLARNRQQWLTDYQQLNQRVTERDKKPFAFVFPAEQRDPQAAAELLELLQRGLVEVHQATAEVVADGVIYPIGSWFVRLDQPAGSFAKTLLEVQIYPELRSHPDGPLKPPYDISGHTLPIQMGVSAFPIQSPLADDAALELRRDPVRYEGSLIEYSTHGNAWVIDCRSNAFIKAVARLQADNVRIFRASTGTEEWNAGDVLVSKPDASPNLMADLGREYGCTISETTVAPETAGWNVRPVRVGLYQSWTSCIDEGWARWVLEEYMTPYETLRNVDIRQGRLRDRIDVLILPEMSEREFREGQTEKTREGDPYPLQYTGGLGNEGIVAVREFVNSGGTLLACDRAANYAIGALALPVENILAAVESDEFSCPGSLLQVTIDPGHPLTLGLPREMAVLFMSSSVFRGAAPDVTSIARYPQTNPLLSGWISGEKKILGASAMVDVTYGQGRVVLYGFRPWFRAQARGTYRTLFNAILRHGMTESTFGTINTDQPSESATF